MGNLYDMRSEYTGSILDVNSMPNEPLEVFTEWIKGATESQDVAEPNAMTLATVNEKNEPSLRVVLLKKFGPEGLTFFTNYKSQKGQDIEHNPHVALSFFWEPLHRQIRVTGKAEKIAASESEEYFLSRPEGSQIGAIISEQSAPIKSRESLQERMTAVEEMGPPYQRPGHWGGYRITPLSWEFWSGPA